ncbi:hypothetical protein AsAng_0056230 [Aureispira anguillae]|uniref:Uncharacterized protein n=1 Tax=Aureispira anguillae TaxID=2864201 RepID=A0A916DVX1_9BACT|nr:hypothetical protein AsAng_0056230 [Aureispira anguillae]
MWDQRTIVFRIGLSVWLECCLWGMECLFRINGAFQNNNKTILSKVA